MIWLALALAEDGFTIAKILGGNPSGGANIVLAVIILWAAIRAMQATFKLHNRSLTEPAADEAG